MVTLTEQQALRTTLDFAKLTPENQAAAKVMLKAYRDDRHANGKPLFPTYDDQRRKQREDVEGWWIDGREPEAIAKSYADAPELKPEARRLQLLGQLTNTDPKVIAPNPGAWRVKVAQAWGNPAAATDDAAFDQLATTKIKEQRDYRYLLEGTGREDDASKATNEAALVNHAALQAKDGKTAAEGFAAWQESAKARPEFAAAKGKNLFEIYAGVHERAAVNFGALQKKAQAIYGLLDREQNNGEPFADTTEAEALIQGLSPAERSMIGEMVGKLAKPKEKGTAQKSGETVGRVFGRLLENASSSQVRTTLTVLDSVQGFKEGDEVAASDAEDPSAIISSAMREMQGRQGTASPGALFAVSSPKGGYVKLTAEQAAEANAELNKRRRSLNTRGFLLDLAEGTVDPVKADSIAGRFGLGALNVGTSMVSFMMGGGAMLNTTAYIEDERRRLENIGVSKEIATAQGLVVGAAQAALDKLQISIFAKLPKTGLTLNSFLAPSSGLVASVGKRALTQGLPTAGFETGIEVVQGALPLMVQKTLASLGVDEPSVSWAEIGNEAWATSEEMFFSMLPLAMLGAGVGGHADYNAARAMVSDAQALEALGFSSAQIESITLPETTSGKVDALRSLWKERTPVLTVAQNEAEQEVDERLQSGTATVSEVAQAAATKADFNAAGKVQTAYAELQKTMADLEDAGVTLTRRQTDGQSEWVVTDRESGKETVTADFREAFQFANGKLGARDLEETEILADAADFFVSQGLGDEITISGEKRLAFDRLTQTPEQLERMAERIRIEERRQGLQEGSLVAPIVLGSNTIEGREIVGDAVKRLVSRSDIYGGGNVLTLVEEVVEGRWKKGLANGVFSKDQGLAWVRLAEQATGETFLEAVENPTMQDVTEAISHIVQAEVFNRSQTTEGGKFARIGKAVTRGLEKIGKDAVEAGRFKTFLEAIRVLFKAIFTTAAKLSAAKREGKLGTEFDAFVDELLGLSEQRAHNQAVVEGMDLGGETNAIASDADYLALARDPEGNREALQKMVERAAVAAGYNVGPVFHGSSVSDIKSFKMGRAGGIYFTEDREYSSGHGPNEYTVFLKFERLADLRHPDSDSLAALIADFNEAGGWSWNEDAMDERDSSDFDPSLDATWEIFDAPVVRGAQWLQSRGYDGALLEENEGIESYVVTAPNQIKSADPVTYDEAGNIIPLSQRFDSSKDSISFSLASADYLEAIAQRLDAAAADPVAKLAAFQRAAGELAGMARAVRFNDANSIKNLSRTGLDRERKRYEATRLQALYNEIDKENPHVMQAAFEMSLTENPLMALLTTPLPGGKRSQSRIISPKELRKQGRAVGGEYDGALDLPGYMFGGKEKPDALAQEAYEAGLIKDAYPDTLWDAIAAALDQSSKGTALLARYKEKRIDARQQAKAEADAWAAKQAKAQEGVDFERRELGRAMAALDAMLISFPPEVRQMVGGFTKLAKLPGNKARLNFFIDRVDKLEAAMEIHLRREYTKEFRKLIDKARPKRDKEKSAKIGGKIGVYGHQWFAMIEPMSKMTHEQMVERLSAIELALADDLTAEKQQALTNEWSLLHAYGNWEGRTAAEMATSFDTALDVYTSGREMWDAVMKLRLLERAQLRNQAINLLGSNGGRASKIKGAKSREGFGGAAKSAVSGFVRNLYSFRQVLADLFGRGSSLEAAYDRRSRSATRNERAARLRREMDFHAAVDRIYGTRNRLQRQRLLYDLSKPVENTGIIFRETSEKEVPISIEIAERILDGRMPDHDLQSYELVELGWLMEDYMEKLVKEGTRQKYLELPRVTMGDEVDMRLSRAQAMKVWMTYQMEEYLPALARDGITKENKTMEQIGQFLTAEDKEFMSWMGEQYEAGYDHMNGPFQRLYGVALPRVKNYAPGTFQNSGNQAVQLPGEKANGGVGAQSSGFLRKRRHHTANIDLSNDAGAISDYWAHVTQTEHWVAWAELVDEMKSVFFNVKVNEAVKAVHGDSAALTLRTWIDTTENDGVRQSYANLELRKWLNSMMGARAKVSLAWKVGVWMKQFTASMGSLMDLPAKDFAKSAARVLSGKSVMRYRDAAGLTVMAQRLRAGGSPEIQMVLSGQAGLYFRPGHLNEFMTTGMDAINQVDARFTMFSAAVAYDAHYRSAIRAGLNETDARAAAAEKTDLTLAKTAQPVETIDRSLHELSMPVLVKPFFMFMSEARKNVALEIAAVVSAMKGQGSWAEAGKLVAVNHLLFGSITWAIGSLWRDAMNDDDDTGDDPAWDVNDWMLSVMTGPLAGIPLLGDVLTGIATWISGARGFPGESNMLSGNMTDMLKGAQALLKDPPEGEELEHYLKKTGITVRALAQILGGEFAAAGVASNVLEQAFNLGDDFIETEAESESKLISRSELRKKELEAEKLAALTSEELAKEEEEKEKKKAERRAKRLREARE